MTTSNFGNDGDTGEDVIREREEQLREERLRGSYVIGGLASGKSRLLTKQDLQDIPIGLNLLSCSESNHPVAVQEVVDKYMQVFKMLWHIGKDTPRLEDTLR